MRLALLFSGQGQQTPEHLHQLRSMADDSLSGALTETLSDVWSGTQVDAEDLSVNVVAQPLIFGFEIAWWRLLKPSLPTPICAAGYSLGEMAACAAADLFASEVGVALCAERAHCMDLATTGATSMAAVLGLPEAGVVAVTQRHGLAIAIRNSPTHFVVTGPVPALDAAMTDFTAAGATKLTPLAVRTPSHTAFLDAASQTFAATMTPFGQGALAFPVISAVNGKLSFTRADAAQALVRQISSMLHWDDALETMIEMQPDVVLEIGPGNALAKMLADVAPALSVRSVCDFRSAEGVLNWLGRYA